MEVISEVGLAQICYQAMTAAVWLWQDAAQSTGQGAPEVQETLNLLEQFWFYLNTKFTVGNLSVSITTFATGLAVLVLSIFVSRTLRGFFERRIAARTHIEPGLQYTLLRLIHYIIVAIGALIGLRLAFALDLTSLAVVFTALSVGIGFGLQYIAGDIASGFILLFERPVRVGDFISVGQDKSETQGKVTAIKLRTTTVQTNDGITVIVPNSKLVTNMMINWTYGNRRARISVPVGVAYDSDVDLVTAQLMRAAQDVKEVLTEPAPTVQFLGFGDSALDFRLLVWTSRPRLHPRIKSEINYRIFRLFREANIEIPFPQREHRWRGDALPVNEVMSDE
ncbi:MAG: mechanosensitive ion channel [Pyrinomonadaceae bacterium MAG19_C2-C3]|nr:mechanosensitive ion channel [Pyrinomonadaceae bacterium MAG19_C2-C3]